MTLFISYDSQDFGWLQILEKHLNPLVKKYSLSLKTDQQILPGTDYLSTRNQFIQEADLILLLITANYLNRNDLLGEMKIYHERNTWKDKLIIPLITDYCIWEETWLSLLSPLPKNGHPLVSDHWPSLNKAMVDIMGDFGEILQERHSRQTLQVTPFNELLTEIHKFNCDRIHQKNKFVEHLYANEGECKLFYFVAGDKNQQVNSFVWRMVNEVLKLEAEEERPNSGVNLHLEISEDGHPGFHFLSKLPYTIRNFRKILSRLIEYRGRKEYTSVDLLQTHAFRHLTYVIIELRIYDTDWSQQSVEFLQWLKDEFCSHHDQPFPKLIFIVSVIFTEDKHRSSLLRILKKPSSRRKESVLKMLKQQLLVDKFSILLPELMAVPYEEITHWFRTVFDNEYEVEERTQELFGTIKGTLNMAEIERKLSMLVDQTNELTARRKFTA